MCLWKPTFCQKPTFKLWTCYVDANISYKTAKVGTFFNTFIGLPWQKIKDWQKKGPNSNSNFIQIHIIICSCKVTPISITHSTENAMQFSSSDNELTGTKAIFFSPAMSWSLQTRNGSTMAKTSKFCPKIMRPYFNLIFREKCMVNWILFIRNRL